jgi:hypothetical protein
VEHADEAWRWLRLGAGDLDTVVGDAGFSGEAPKTDAGGALNSI